MKPTNIPSCSTTSSNGNFEVHRVEWLAIASTPEQSHKPVY